MPNRDEDARVTFTITFEGGETVTDTMPAYLLKNCDNEMVEVETYFGSRWVLHPPRRMPAGKIVKVERARYT